MVSRCIFLYWLDGNFPQQKIEPAPIDTEKNFEAQNLRLALIKNMVNQSEMLAARLRHA